MPASAQKRHLNVIAEDIDEDWPNPHYTAVPYLEAMRSLRMVTDHYGEDDGKSVVLYFLSNASSWKGEKAREIKAELRAIVK